MAKVTNVLGDVKSGTIADTAVFASWKGINYVRQYVKPSNPNTPAQQTIRNSFKNAVDKTHTWNDLQKKSYNYMASGEAMTWFNVFISRWQKMTPAERSSYVDPYFGFKQIGIGSAKTDGSDVNVTDTKLTTLTHKPVVLGSIGYTKGSGTHDPVAVVELNRGRIDFIKPATGAITVSYEASGKVITDEAIQTNASIGDVAYLKYMDVNPATVHVKVGGTEVDAVELDFIAGTVRVCNLSTFTGGSSYTYNYYTPLQNVTMACVKASTTFATWNGYSDSNGVVELAQTSEDGTRDITYSLTNYTSIVKSGVSASNTAKDEYIAMVAT